jgi:DNA-binding MarR family transcriptional regulator
MSKKYLQQLASILQMLDNLDKDLNLVKYNETEKKIYYTIASQIHSCGKCNITVVIESSGFSRSTVYKAIRKFEDDRMVQLIKSNADRREIYLDLIAV